MTLSDHKVLGVQLMRQNLVILALARGRFAHCLPHLFVGVVVRVVGIGVLHICHRVEVFKNGIYYLLLNMLRETLVEFVVICFVRPPGERGFFKAPCV